MQDWENEHVQNWQMGSNYKTWKVRSTPHPHPQKLGFSGTSLFYMLSNALGRGWQIWARQMSMTYNSHQPHILPLSGTIEKPTFAQGGISSGGKSSILPSPPLLWRLPHQPFSTRQTLSLCLFCCASSSSSMRLLLSIYSIKTQAVGLGCTIQDGENQGGPQRRSILTEWKDNKTANEINCK